MDDKLISQPSPQHDGETLSIIIGKGRIENGNICSAYVCTYVAPIE